MLLSIRKTQTNFEIYDLDAFEKVVATFDERWKAIAYLRRNERGTK